MSVWSSIEREILTLSGIAGIKCACLISAEGDILVSGQSEISAEIIELIAISKKIAPSFINLSGSIFRRAIFETDSGVIYFTALNENCLICALLEEVYDILSVSMATERASIKISYWLGGHILNEKKRKEIESNIARQLFRLYKRGESRKQIDPKIAGIIFGSDE